MRATNKHICTGRLTADPQLRETQNGQHLVRFRLAVDRRVKREGQPDADFFSFVCFGKLADFAWSYLTKGSKVLVDSHPQNSEYTRDDGTTVRDIEFIAESIEFCESKADRDRRKSSGQEDEGLPF